MCGLSGFITNKKNSRFAQEQFIDILIESEKRGTDASGIAFNGKRRDFFYFKAPIPASDLIKQKNFIKLIKETDPTMMIGHNRQKTQGSELNNNNNHPIITDTGLSLIHNGIIWNEKEIAKDFNIELESQVDSEIIVKLIEYYKIKKGFSTDKAIRLTCQKVRGSMACGLLNALEPRTMYLWTSNNPLNFAYHIKTKTIFFASTEDILETALIRGKSYYKGFFYQKDEREYIFESATDETGYKMTLNNWQSFDIKRPDFTTSSRDSRHYENDTVEKPLEIEAGKKKDIAKLLKKQGLDFQVMSTIKKPSEYLSELLFYRLETIQDLLSSGDYKEYYADDEIIEIQNEIKRIVNTLTMRKEKTNRKMYIPKVSEIWDLIKTPKNRETDFRHIKWVLTDKNRKLLKMLSKAEIEDRFTEPEQKDIPFD